MLHDSWKNRLDKATSERCAENLDMSPRISNALIGASEFQNRAEDGSYGTNGDAIFGFTPEEIYIESNMKYITSSVPLNFQKPVNRLAIIETDEAKKILEASKKAMGK